VCVGAVRVWDPRQKSDPVAVMSVCLSVTLSVCVGAVKVWDPRQKSDPVAVMQPADGDDRRDCWAVAFGK